MTESTWMNEKGALLEKPKRKTWQFVAVGAVLVAAVVFVIVNALNTGGTQLYVTVDEYYAQQDTFIGRDVRVSGWVIGDSIKFEQIDAETSRLEFQVVDDLNDPNAQRLTIVAMNEPLPDLLQHEAQALVEGRAGDGVFMSNSGGLLLKCPTRYEEDGVRTPHNRRRQRCLLPQQA